MSDERTEPPFDPFPGDRRHWLAAALALIALVALLFADVLVGRASIDGPARIVYEDGLYTPPAGTPSFRDQSSEQAFAPWDRFIAREWLAGRPPLWNPDNGLGMPLLGNGQAGALAPGKLPLLATGGQWPGWYMLGRLLLGGLGALALVGYLGLGPLAALLAGLGFALNGQTLGHFTLADVPVVGVLPWLVLAVVALMRRPTRARLATVGALIALCAFQGHAEVALFIAAGGVFTGLFTGSVAIWWRRYLALAAAIALGAALAAVLVLPFFELVRESRSYLSDHRGLLDYITLRSALTELAGHLVTPLGAGYNAYVGVVLALLSVVGVWHRAIRREALALAGLGLLAIGLLPPTGVLTNLPFVPNSFYATSLIALGICLAGAAGFEFLRTAPRPAFPVAMGLLCGLVAAALLAAYMVLFVNPEAVRQPWLAGQLGLAGATLALVTPWALLALFRGLEPVAAIAVLVIGLCHLGLTTRQTIGLLPPIDYPPTPIVQHLKSVSEGPFRVASGATALIPNTNQVHGLESFEQYEVFHPTRYAAYMAAVNRGDARMRILNHQILAPNFHLDLTDLANVRFFVAGHQASAKPFAEALAMAMQKSASSAVPTSHLQVVAKTDHATLYESTSALPRLRMLYRADFRPPGTEAVATELAYIPSRWRERVLLEVPGGEAPTNWKDAPFATGRVSLKQRTPLETVCEVNGSADGFLVQSDLFFPGWEAELDGRPTQIYPAYAAFRAVFVPMGQHQVRFVYRPASVARGANWSFGGLVCLFALWFWPRLRERDGEGGIEGAAEAEAPEPGDTTHDDEGAAASPVE